MKFTLLINGEEIEMNDHDFFDHDREDDFVKIQYNVDPSDEQPDLCDTCGGLRNAHLDNDACDTCALCLDAEQLVDVCKFELDDANARHFAALKNAGRLSIYRSRRRLFEATKNLKEAEAALRVRKENKKGKELK